MAGESRKCIGKRTRFEVFKRDAFTCQYCGGKSPHVVLEVDHITPVSAGGDNDILNLVTACKACNSGKSDRLLSDTAALDRRRGQLEELEQRRQQIEMLHAWHSSLVDAEEDAVRMAWALWLKCTGRESVSATEEAAAEIRKLTKRHDFQEVCQAIRDAAEAYKRSHKDDHEAYMEWFWKIGRILKTRRMEADNPGLGRLLYIRGILRNRIHMYPSGEWQSIALLKQAHSLGVPLEWMQSTAKSVRSWSDWRWLMEDAIQQYSGEEATEQEATDGTDA